MKTTTLLLPIFALVSVFGAVRPAHAAPDGNGGVYRIDPAHSSISFSIRHFIAEVTGTFERFEGTIQYHPGEPEKNSVSASVQIASVDTNEDDRDAHLQAEDYFHAGKHPEMTFRSTKWEASGEDRYKVTGDLTIRGQTHPVTLEVQLLGFAEGFEGAYLSGWKATTELDRTRWGVSAGQPAVGSSVDVVIRVEAVRQPTAEN